MSKTIIVTGAATAHGRAIILTLADEGHGVVAIIDPVKEAGLPAAKELRQTANVEVVEVDLKNDQSVKNGFSLILRRYGHVDVLITIEPLVKLGPAQYTSIEAFHELFDVNVCGALRAIKALLPTMKKNKGGLLINVNSGVNYFAAPLITALSMAKAGLEILTDGILSEVKRFGIGCVCLYTGYYPAEFSGDPMLSASDPMEDTLLEDDHQLRLEGTIPDRNKPGKQQAQAVASLVLELINMPGSSRPQRCSLNPAFAEADKHFITAKKLAEEAWGMPYET